MHQLGLHELAEAVLGRARRRAGNKAAALVGLMLQYQRQDKLDVAVQVAMQILRSTTATRQTNPNVYNADDPDASRAGRDRRAVAIRPACRSSSTRPRSSSRRRPTPSSIHQALADYYKAAGQRDKARAELAKIVELRPDDTNLRFQVAQQLVQEGQAAAAIEHYKVILKKDPSVLVAVLLPGPERLPAGQQDRRAAGPARDHRPPPARAAVLRHRTPSPTFLNDDKLRDRAMPLLRKVWDMFPDDHSYLFGYIRGEAIWQYPEMYEYGREALVVPKPETFGPNMQWEGFDSSSRTAATAGSRPWSRDSSTWPPRRASSTSSRRRSTPPARRCRTGRPAPSCGPWSTAAWAASTAPTR